jgi:hypothetical protein
MAVPLLQYLAIIAGFVGSVALLGLAARWFCGSVRFRVPRRRPRPESVLPPPRRPLEVVAADLRRLARQLAHVPAGAPMARRRGFQAAYDDVLVEAAQLLEVPHTLRETPDGLAREVERLRVQAALADAGLVVHG